MVSVTKYSHVAVAFHAYTPPGGLAVDLLDYLRARTKRVSFIVHPFPSARMPLNSRLQVYEHGKLTGEFKTPAPRGPDPLVYLLDVLFTLYLVMRGRQRIDLFIGLDNLNAFSGLVLKKLGLAKSVVFYVIDYVPQRFASRWLNAVYHWIDRFCCRHVDCIWNVSGNMMDARQAKWGSLNGCAPFLEVPLGCNYERIGRLAQSQIDAHAVAFLGTLAPEQGVHLLLEAWPAVRAGVPDATLAIIGGGAQAAELQERARRIGVESSVRFLGFVADDREVEGILAHCAVGVAPYAQERDSFKYYADPGKVKLYLAAGLPVIITRVPPIAERLDAAQAGIAINHDAAELSSAIIRLLTQPELYARYRENAICLAAQYSWTNIFDTALAATPTGARGKPVLQ